MNLTDLLSTLAQGWPAHPLPTAPASIRFVGTANPRFVDPPLRVEKAIQQDTRIVLLSSPAALGKSTVAAEIAHRQNAPLWDLSKAMLGTGSFEGTLVRSFGAAAYARVEEALKGGQALFVIDSLDEGQLRVPSTSFEEFVNEVCAFLASARPSRPAIVLLGRSDAALWMSFWLEDKGVPFAHLVLDFFLEDQAYDFVVKWLDSKGHTAHRGYRDAFRRSCQSLFQQIASILGAAGTTPAWEQPAVRAFLGYAPVLECIAEYLRVGNYEKLDSTLRKRTTDVRSEAAGDLLTRFAEELMRREQHEKVIPAMKERLAPIARKYSDWKGWETLYQPEEQQQRVFEFSLAQGHQLPSQPVPSGMPPELRTAYDEAISEFVAMHPFAGGRETRGFAGTVFEEYVYAWAMQRHPLAVAPLLERRLADDGYLPTPLLSWFCLGRGTDGALQLNCQTFGPFYDSALAAEEHSGRAVSSDLVILEGNGSRSALIAPGDHSQEFTIQLLFEEESEPIVVWRRLRDAFIDVRCPVRLGIRGVPFSIGPNVELQCGRLTVDASEFRVFTDRLEGTATTAEEVLIEADQYLGSHPEPRIRRYGEGWFGVWWPDLTYPWVGHQGRRSGLAGADPRLAGALTQLRRILRRFRMHAGIGISAGTALVNNVAVGHTQDDALLLEYLLERGILRTYGRLYVLDSAGGDRVGLNWASIHRPEPDDPILNFLGKFLDWIDAP